MLFLNRYPYVKNVKAVFFSIPLETYVSFKYVFLDEDDLSESESMIISPVNKIRSGTSLLELSTRNPSMSRYCLDLVCASSLAIKAQFRGISVDIKDLYIFIYHSLNEYLRNFMKYV